MKACKIDIDTWENAAGDRARWGQKDKQGIEQADSERGLKAADKKGPVGNSALLQQPTHPQASSALPAAGTADRGLALYSHTRRCKSTTTAD